MTDWLGLIWFLAAWIGYEPVTRLVGRRWRLVNTCMFGIRRLWMETMLSRENRMPDVVLLGHVVHSASFFASTTVIVIAALFGALGSIDRLQSAIETLIGAPAERPALDIKLALVLIVVVRGFFAFTWAIRQFNYAIALIGAAPPAPVEPMLRRALAKDLGEALSLAVMAFNSGVRAYYFALAGLTWLANPVLFVISTSAVVVLLLWRQTSSPSARLIQRVEEHQREPQS